MLDTHLCIWIFFPWMSLVEDIRSTPMTDPITADVIHLKELVKTHCRIRDLPKILDAMEAACSTYGAFDGFDDEFQFVIGIEHHAHDASSKVGSWPSNVKKNRFKNVLPCEFVYNFTVSSRFSPTCLYIYIYIYIFSCWKFLIFAFIALSSDLLLLLPPPPCPLCLCLSHSKLCKSLKYIFGYFLPIICSSANSYSKYFFLFLLLT